MRTTFVICAVIGALFAALVSTSLAPTEAAANANADMAKYLGYWNYDQPNELTLNNVSVLACPDGTGACDRALPLPLRVPQVGWELFTPGPNGTVNGTSDQGCTWNFKVTRTGLELSSTTQQCFNPAVGSWGNLTKWNVQVKGNRETEQITAISHQPDGVDLIGTMKTGSRTKVVPGRDGGKFIHGFVGDYTRTPADMHSLVNVAVTDQGMAYPAQDALHITADRAAKGRINAHTADGCNWSFSVRGNTAELDPATQTCHTETGDLTLLYWAMATDDGRHINDFLHGTITRPGMPTSNVYLYSGLLAR
ncbi:hypothetical protein ACPA54_30760 [Uniformispora flossi]|uniref:hypothetical protein n=1 Tax=Uniformispora flossi TaxID=3390723 RepID=UPI003C2B0220